MQNEHAPFRSRRLRPGLLATGDGTVICLSCPPATRGEAADLAFDRPISTVRHGRDDPADHRAQIAASRS